MAKRLINDELWQLIQPHLPPRQPHPKGGRPTVQDRDVLTGIVFVLKTGIHWDDLPDEMGCGCGMTCFRRLRDWHHNGVWQRIQPILKNRLHYSERVDWERANVDVMPRRSGRGRHAGDGQAIGAEVPFGHPDEEAVSTCAGSA
jgi:transposase